MFQPEKALETVLAKVATSIHFNQLKRQFLAPAVNSKTVQLISHIGHQHLISVTPTSEQVRPPPQPPSIGDNKTAFQLQKSKRKQLLFPEEIGQIRQRLPFKQTASIAEERPVQLQVPQASQGSQQDDKLRREKEEQRKYRLRSMSVRPAPTSSQLKERKKRLKDLQAKAKQRIYYTYQYDGSIIKAQNFVGTINVPRLKSKLDDAPSRSQAKTVPVHNILIQKAPSKKQQEQSRTFDFESKDISTLDAFRPVEGSKFTENYGQHTKFKEQLREKSIRSCSLKQYKQEYKSIKLLSPKKQVINPLSRLQQRKPSAAQNSLQLDTIQSKVPPSLKSLLEFRVSKFKPDKSPKKRELRGMRKSEWERIQRRLHGQNRLSKYFYQKLQDQMRKVRK